MDLNKARHYLVQVGKGRDARDTLKQTLFTHRTEQSSGTKNFSAQTSQLGRIAIIEAIDPDGRLVARLDNNRQIEFKASEHRHFDHGYAVTSHSSQGLTVERVLVHADTRVHPDLLNSRFGYVSISRASHEATLFTDDMAKLAPQLAADVSKTSALEISQTPSVGMGIGIGI